MRAPRCAIAAALLAACGSGTGGDTGTSGPPGPPWPGKAKQVSIGIVNTCAVALDGSGYCWGSNADLQLTWPHAPISPCSAALGGTNRLEWPCVANAPVPVTGNITWQSLSWGKSEGPLCGIDSAGTAWCMTNFAPANNVVDYPADVVNASGIPMCSGLDCRLVPLKLKGGGAWRSFDFGFGESFACGLQTSGAAACVGGNSQYGSLGSGTIGELILTPRAVQGAKTFTQVAVGYSTSHACGIASDQTAWCWGKDDGGELGYGSAATPNRFPSGVPYPIAVSGGKKYKWITAGVHSTCALDLSGAAFCWGTSHYGSFGGGTSDVRVTAPIAAAGGKLFARIEAGVDTTCGVDTAGDGWCWGRNDYGQLGTGASPTVANPSPLKVAGGLKWKTIVPGVEHTCGIASDDVLYCWGRNTAGQLGAPAKWIVSAGQDSNVPVEVGK